jgi:hypothetical protein
MGNERRVAANRLVIGVQLAEIAPAEFVDAFAPLWNDTLVDRHVDEGAYPSRDCWLPARSCHGFRRAGADGSATTRSGDRTQNNGSSVTLSGPAQKANVCVFRSPPCSSWIRTCRATGPQ